MLRITAKHFCAGAILAWNIVIAHAPILRYMRGWSVSEVESYCRKKGWKCERLD